LWIWVIRPQRRSIVCAIWLWYGRPATLARTLIKATARVFQGQPRTSTASVVSSMPASPALAERVGIQGRSPRRPEASQSEPMAIDYQRPGWFTKHVFNPIVAGLTRVGLSLAGSRVLEVRGRKSGEWRRTPVNPLEFEGQRYIVAPRGETQWVRNLRASSEGRLRKGRRAEEFTAIELADEEKLPLLRAYLKKWAWEVGAFFQGVGADAPDEDLRQIAPLHPIFRISRRS
jgi:deazaflavin-dependent oxidoreductase (nitroreductase family)